MSYRFERFAEREAARTLDEIAEIERLTEQDRLSGRSLWQRIYDLRESDELKEILWALMPEEQK